MRCVKTVQIELRRSCEERLLETDVGVLEANVEVGEDDEEAVMGKV